MYTATKLLKNNLDYYQSGECNISQVVPRYLQILRSAAKSKDDLVEGKIGG